MKRICVFAGSSLGTKASFRAATEDLGRVLVSSTPGALLDVFDARVGLVPTLRERV
jgi:hypothetical protein